MRSRSMLPVIILLFILLMNIPHIATSSKEDMDPYENIMPLLSQIPLSFDGYDGDSNGDRIDDILYGGDKLDSLDGMIGINVHMAGPVSANDVRSIMGRAKTIGLDPVFLRVGTHTTAIYLLVRESGDYEDLLIGGVNFIEYRPMMVPFLDTSSPTIRAGPSSLYSPFSADDLGITGEGVTIAIMDSGVDNNHESLIGKYEYGADFTGTTTFYGVNPNDSDGHGTHVAGTAMGTGGSSETYRGVAPGASLVDLKIFISFGSFLGNSDQAFEWLIDNHEERGIKVVSCSFGTTSPTSGRDTTSQLANRLVDEGVVVVVAAGNDGTQGLPSPASADKVITVGAYGDQGTIGRNDDTVQGFSNRGPRESDGDMDKLDELKPDVCAPGVDIRAPNHNSLFEYVEKTGTSMSCPHISGLAALMLQANPDLTPAQIKSIMRDTAEQDYSPSQPSVDSKYNARSGWGQVDAYGAVKRALDLLSLDLSAPGEVSSGDPVDIIARGKFTKTGYDSDEDIHEIEIRTPNDWGRPDNIEMEADLYGTDPQLIGPIRSGDSWVTTMKTYYNSSVEGAVPSLSFSIVPIGEEGDSGVISARTSINGMNFVLEEREVNITDGPSPPDLSIVPLAISFSDNLPENGDNVQISVRVNNTGGRSVEDALVRLLDGPERTGEMIGEDTIRVPAGSSGIASFIWVANPGIHAITAIADPDNEIAESDESNNGAERPLTVLGINPPPIAQLEVSPTEGTTTTRFLLDGSSSQDTNIRGGNVVAYNFDFGDGMVSGWVDTAKIEHRYQRGGSYTASLVVRDNGGEESSNNAEATINVSDVTSLKETLFLTNNSRLMGDPGPSGYRSVMGGRIGEWISDPFQETRTLNSFLSIRLIVDSSGPGKFDYEISFKAEGASEIGQSDQLDLQGGEGSYQIDIPLDEITIRPGGDISILISGSSSADGTQLLIGEGGSFLEYLYYLPQNQLPEVFAGNDMEVRVGSPITFSGTAEDVDGSIEEIRWDVDSDGEYESEGVLTFEYGGYSEEGIYKAVLEVKDDDGGWSTDSLEVTVRSSDYNFPPEVLIDCHRNITGIVTISGTANDDISVEKVEIKIISTEETVLEWTEADGQEEWSLEWDSRTVGDGIYEINARAFDGSIYSNTAKCEISVSNTNTPPKVDQVIIEPGSMISGQDLRLLITASVQDPDLPGDELSVIADLDPIEGPIALLMEDDGRGADDKAGDSIYSAGFEPSLDIQPGVYRIFVEVQDSNGGVDQGYFDFEVIADIRIFSSISSSAIDSGEEVLIEVEVDTSFEVIVKASSELFRDGFIFLLDDGLEGDRVMGDRVYSRRIMIEGEPGKYPITITVEDEGVLLSREEMVLRIKGTSEPVEGNVGGADPSWTILLVILIILTLISILIPVILIRRGRTGIPEEPIQISSPIIAEVIEDDFLQGELSVQGEMPEISQYTQGSYEEGYFQAE